MKKNFRKKVLKNGLTVIFEKRDVPLVSLAIAAKAGGINESESEKGISHFIEHMLYKGTKKRSAKDIAFEIEKNGGDLNGFTSEEITAFWCKLPSEKAKIGLEILSDMIKNPLFDPIELEKERKVIFEELKMRKDNPRIYVFDKTLESLYEKPLGLDLIGTYESMNSITRDDLIKKWKETYASDNLVLCCVGNFNFEKLVSFAERTFDKSKSKVNFFKIKKKNKKSTEKRKGVDQANLVFSTHGPLINEKMNPAFFVLFSLMGDGMSSILYSEIREKRNLAYAVKPEVDSSKNYCYGSIYVGTNKENLSKIKKIILKEFENVSKNFSEKELKEIKTQIIGNHIISLESSQGQMMNLLHSEISEGGAENFYSFEKKIKDVKLKDVQKLASKIKKGNYSFFALVPEKE